MYTIDFHGDDYGISKNNCIRFVELMKAGHIDSISVIPNMDYYQEGMNYLKENWDDISHKPLISVHINIIDGLSLSAIDDPGLSRIIEDGRYVMNASWGKLLLLSYLPLRGKKRIKSYLTAEIGDQIERVCRDLPEGCELRLDSHVHTHMIPIVFDAMMATIKERGLIDRCSFVRVSREPLWVFLSDKSEWNTYAVINIIKNILLNILAGRAERKLRRENIPYSCLWGLIMTGHMDQRRVDKLMPAMKRWLSKRKDNDNYLEILCHPGIVLENESSPLYGEDDMEAFFSKYRNVEYNMLVACNKTV